MNDSKNPVSRREFLSQSLNGAAALAACTVCGSLVAACGKATSKTTDTTITSTTVNVTSETDLGVVGGAVKKTVTGFNGSKPFLIVRTDTAEYKAMTAVCSHQGTELPVPTANAITCPNHGAIFSAASSTFGTYVGGTQTAANLTVFTTTLDSASGTLTIKSA